MTFCLEKCKSIVIYGYNKRGRYIKKFLEEKGKKGIFFIDKNAEKILQENVYTIEKLNEINKKETAIIISLQNAIAHRSVSEEVYKTGINKIVFIPVGGKFGEKETMNLRKYYNELSDCVADIRTELSVYDEIVLKNKIRNKNGIINQDDKFTAFWMNIHNLYITEDKECFAEADETYLGKPVILADYYQAFFDFLKNAQDNELVKKYMKIQGYQKQDGSYDEKILAGRYELWSLYKEEINKGMKFFCSSPIRVQPGDGSRFDVKDGLHRTTFLYMQNMMYIPVVLRTEVFEELYSEKELRKLVDYMEENAIYKLCTPIEHPAFYGFPCEKEKQEPSVLSSIQKYIGKADIEEWDILDISDYNSYFARMMSKRRRKPGNGRILSVETDEKMYTLAKYINEVLHVENVELVLENDNAELPERKYGIVFALGRWSGEKYSESRVRFLDRVTEKVLFWESNSLIAEEEIQKILTGTSFKQCKQIFHYFDGMQCKNVYAIEK